MKRSGAMWRTVSYSRGKKSFLSLSSISFGCFAEINCKFVTYTDFSSPLSRCGVHSLISQLKAEYSFDFRFKISQGQGVWEPSSGLGFLSISFSSQFSLPRPCDFCGARLQSPASAPAPSPQCLHRRRLHSCFLSTLMVCCFNRAFQMLCLIK